VNVVTVTGQDMEGIAIPPATDTHATAILVENMYLPLVGREP
jgi:hypothetical protein